jgi:hypothetical protein
LRVVAGAVSTVTKILFRIFSSFFSYPNYFRNLLLLIAILISIVHLNAQTYVFARLDGIPMNTNGWTLKGEAAVKDVILTNKSELLLCSAKKNTSGAVFFNQPINLSLCNRWKAEFDFRMNGGTAADGIAFNFLDAPPTGFVLGQGLGIPSGANGLKVCFDTYNNCILPTSSKVPKIEIRYGAGLS